jgi:hypothetical protein
LHGGRLDRHLERAIPWLWWTGCQPLITDLVGFLNSEIDRNAREAAELDVARQAAQILGEGHGTG